MKKLKAFGLLVIVLALSLAFIACGDGGGSTTGANGDNTFQNKVYSGKKGNDTYSLNISRGSQTSKAYISSGDWTPANGDAYKLVIALGSGVNKTSEGTVTSFSGGVLTLASSGSSFTVKVGGSTISEIKGAIPITSSSDNNTAPLTAPGSLISSSSGGGGGSLSGGIKPPTQTAQVLTFTSGEYEIIITEKLSTSRAAYEPKDGDPYVIKKGGVVISQGTVTRGAVTETGEITLIFTPTNPHTSGYTFTATLGSGILEFDSAITDDNGDVQNIPPLRDQKNNYGIAKTEPIETPTTIAGISYSAKETVTITNNWSFVHYLLKGKYEDAYNALKADYGDGNSDVSLVRYSSLANSVQEDGGFIFEMFTETRTGSAEVAGPINDSTKSYRLCEWVEAIIGEGRFGEWSGYEWSNSDISSDLSEDPGPPTKIGTLEYTDKVSDSGTENWSYTDYLLSIPFDNALSILTELWDVPEGNRYVFGYHTQLAQDAWDKNPNDVIFQKVTFSNEWKVYVLVKKDLHGLKGVLWQYSPGH